MAQETAASITAPEGGLFRAWTDALLHPKFETYARWYLKMNARWRLISLTVSLPLLLVAIFVAAIFTVSATAALFANRSIGRYRIRYYIAYCTWMQTLPMTSILLLVGAGGYLVLGFFDSTSFIDQAATYLFIGLPMLFALGLICTGLSAATLRHSFLIY